MRVIYKSGKGEKNSPWDWEQNRRKIVVPSPLIDGLQFSLPSFLSSHYNPTHHSSFMNEWMKMDGKSQNRASCAFLVLFGK